MKQNDRDELPLLSKHDGTRRGKNAKRESESGVIVVIDARSSARGLKFLISESGRTRWVSDNLLAEEAWRAADQLIEQLNKVRALDNHAKLIPCWRQ
jgi:hypothetical protein